MSVFASVRGNINALVHPSAQQDALTAEKHRAFIAPRLLGGILALAALPIYLAVKGGPGLIEAAVFAWFVAPILAACFLSRTGLYETSHVLSALTLTALTFAIAFYTGGSASFAAVWLIVVPFEAALSSSRRVIVISSALAFAAATLLLVLTPGALSADVPLATLGIVPVVVYAAALALGTELLVRKSVDLRNAEEDRYRLLALHMTDVITRHGRNGTVQFVSPASRQLLGAEPRELLGHGLFERVHVADRPAYLSALADATAGNTAVSVEFRVRTRSNGADAFAWIEMRCRPLDNTDENREVVGVLRDIGARKTQEDALESARAELERANAGKGRFLATMSHELRTPLNAIIGFSQMLQKEGELRIDATRRAEYARLIHDSGEHLLSVVNGILDMSKMESGNFEITPEPFAPGAVISSCCDILGLKAHDAGVTLKTHLPSALPEIVADRRALNQILINLVSNAIKFTGRDGKVTVMAAHEGANLIVTVEDTGVGIGADDMPRLGEAFFQSRASYDRRHDGSGLGLSIVKGLVDLHGGKLEIRSRVDEGTHVTVSLPIDCEGARRTAQPIQISRERTNVPMPVEVSTTPMRKRA